MYVSFCAKTHRPKCSGSFKSNLLWEPHIQLLREPQIKIASVSLQSDLWPAGLQNMPDPFVEWSNW